MSQACYEAQNTVAISNKLGLHARAAAKLAACARQYDNDIAITLADKTVNATNIMGLMLLAASKGKQLTVNVSGNDAHIALNAIINLIEQGFGESE